MIISDRGKGYLLTFIATLAMSNVYLFSKAALNDIHLAQFGFYWFGFAVLWNFIYGLFSCRYRNIWKTSRKSWITLGLIAVLEILATTFMFTAIQTMENPAFVSFISNVSPFFVTILGILFLGEVFKRLEIPGIVLTIVGAFIVSYKPGTSLSDIFIPGASYAFLSAFFVAVSMIIAKISIRKVHPLLISLNRVVYLFVYSFIMLLVLGQSFVIDSKPLGNIFVGSLLGPFLTAFTGYYALKYIEASRASLIRSTKSIFVLLGAFIMFGQMPEIYQIIGGLISLIGVILLTVGRSKKPATKTK
ncbi:MAG: DMT family transporter [Bacteroidales bacterium]|nr:DMT family transporter [Bacteroidales bacterium]